MSEKVQTSAKEVAKLPTSRCGRCGLEAVSPIVVDGHCRNERACTRRVALKLKAAQRRKS